LFQVIQTIAIPVKVIPLHAEFTRQLFKAALRREPTPTQLLKD
jgi:hypothetical protein